MPGSTTTAALPPPLELGLRVGLACALTLALAVCWGRAIVEGLLPLLRAYIPWLDSNYALQLLDITHNGADTALRLKVNLAKPILVGAQLTQPVADGWLEVTTTLGSALQAPLLTLTLLLAWPLAHWREACWRAVAGLVTIFAVFLVDAPLVLWAYLWEMHVNAYEPGRFSPLLIWKDFLLGGGHLALGLGAGLLVLVLTRGRAAAKA